MQRLWNALRAQDPFSSATAKDEESSDHRGPTGGPGGPDGIYDQPLPEKSLTEGVDPVSLMRQFRRRVLLGERGEVERCLRVPGARDLAHALLFVDGEPLGLLFASVVPATMPHNVCAMGRGAPRYLGQTAMYPVEWVHSMLHLLLALVTDGELAATRHAAMYWALPHVAAAGCAECTERLLERLLWPKGGDGGAPSVPDRSDSEWRTDEHTKWAQLRADPIFDSPPPSASHGKSRGRGPKPVGSSTSFRDWALDVAILSCPPAIKMRILAHPVSYGR